MTEAARESDVAAALRHGATYRVRFDEAGPDGIVRTSALLRYAQDVGWLHSEAAGLTRAWYAERGLAWVVRAAALAVLEPVPMGVSLDVTTRVVGYQRIWAQRRAECRLPDGTLAGWVRTDWVMIDGRGRLTRVPPEIPEHFPAPLLDEPLLRVPLGEPPPEATTVHLAVRPHDLDPMNHPNNAVYVDWFEEALVAAGPAGASAAAARPRELQLEYAAAAAPGADLRGLTWPDGSGWSFRLTAADGTAVLRARLHRSR
jgi:acyl-CoA thioesterase FadM